LIISEDEKLKLNSNNLNNDYNKLKELKNLETKKINEKEKQDNINKELQKNFNDLEKV
jgi:hypothetical protein